MGWGCVGCSEKEDSPCGSTSHWKPLLVPWSPSPGSSPGWWLMPFEHSPKTKTKHSSFVHSYLFSMFTVGLHFWQMLHSPSVRLLPGSVQSPEQKRWGWWGYSPVGLWWVLPHCSVWWTRYLSAEKFQCSWCCCSSWWSTALMKRPNETLALRSAGNKRINWPAPPTYLKLVHTNRFKTIFRWTTIRAGSVMFSVLK